MQKAVQFLPFATRGLAICAVLAGLSAGLLVWLGGALACMDTCPTRDVFFVGLGPLAVRWLTPCVALEALTLLAFLAYCLATRQPWRAAISILFLLVGGLASVATLSALLRHAQDTLPVGEGGVLVGTGIGDWMGHWGLAVALVAGAWSGVPALIQWRR